MIKSKKSLRPRILQLKKETLIVLELDKDVLHDVVGGNGSTVKSQCPTLCFT